MRSKWYIVLLLIASIFLLNGCEEKEEEDQEIQAHEVFGKYVDLWNEQKFTDMYEMLSNSAKELITKDEFTDRYEKIYHDLGVTDLQVQFEKPEKNEEPEGDTQTNENNEDEKITAQLPFSVSMNTVAGPIVFDQEAELEKVGLEEGEEVNWTVKWHTGFIFAGMEHGDKILIQSIEPVRGEIVDRNGNGLAINGEVKEVGLVPERMGDQETEIKEQVSQLLGISVESINKALSASWVQPHYFVPIKRIPNTKVDLVDQLLQIQGVQINTAQSRVYPLGEASAHLIGYVDEVTAEDLENNEGYKQGDVIGKRGLEQLFETRLKGETGIKIFIEKPNGVTVTLAEKPVKNGDTIQLTVDSNLQQEIINQFNRKAGTAVAIHPKTGETLAIVSSPSFDPNEYMFMNPAERQAVGDDPLDPLTNRFVYAYTPGSVMKPFTAAIALEKGKLDPELKRDITGRQWQKDSSWGGYFITRISNPGRPVNLRDALVYSDNIYFARTALEMGAEDFVEGMSQFGFGEEIPFTYPLYSSQLSNDGNLNSEILLADSGYGQGQVLTNIVHLAAGYSVFVNDGNMIQPILLKEETPSQVWKEGIVSSEHVDLITANLREVVTDANGTGRLVNIPNLPLAGKTGTAEVSKKDQGERAIENGWFVAFNTDTQDLLIAMTMENIQDENSPVVVQAIREIFESR